MRSLPRPAPMDVLLATMLTGLTVATLVARTGHTGIAAGALAVLSVAPVASWQVAPVPATLVIGAAIATSRAQAVVVAYESGLIVPGA